MKKLWFYLVTISLLTACSKDDRERLFEMSYPAIDFEIPAGLSASLPRVFERDNIPTNIRYFLNEYNLDTAQIGRILPFSARLTALDNIDYDFVDEISVRICEADAEQCLTGDEVFYIDNLQGREDDVIELLPGLGDAKDILTQDEYKLEVVFFFWNTTPISVRSRLDMIFEAVE